MYAILIACSIVLNDDRSIWNANIPNPNPIIYGNYRLDIKNLYYQHTKLQNIQIVNYLMI